MADEFTEFVNYLSGNMLDRGAHVRKNWKWLKSALTSSSSRFMILKNLNPLCVERHQIDMPDNPTNPNDTVWSKFYASRSGQKYTGKSSTCYLKLCPYSEVQPFVKQAFSAANSSSSEQSSTDVCEETDFWPSGLLFMGLDKGMKHEYPEQVSTGNPADNSAWFALDVTNHDKSLLEKFETGSSFSGEYLPSRVAVFRLHPAHSSLYAQARSILAWQDRYKHCASCGGEMFLEEAGHKGTCIRPECRSNKGVHNTCYPRTDPSVIMCVQSPDGRKCLLGRKKIFPAGMYSCLAGFVEPGESAEDAVVRETMEESGVEIHRVQYHSSQPWPFPSSLMLGYIAEATSDQITVCEEEMDDVQWFERAEVILALKGESKTLMVPPKETIAHQLIKAWTLRTNTNSHL